MTVTVHRDVEQGTDEWLALRCGLLTASEVHNIITPTGKPAKNEKMRSHAYDLLAQRITGYVDPRYISDDMLRGYDDERPNHQAVAIAVAGGEGDAGAGIESVARQVKDVDFVPLQKEWYDMVIPESRWEEPAMKALIAFACSEEFRRELSRIGTYDFSESGKIFRV